MAKNKLIVWTVLGTTALITSAAITAGAVIGINKNAPMKLVLRGLENTENKSNFYSGQKVKFKLLTPKNKEFDYLLVNNKKTSVKIENNLFVLELQPQTRIIEVKYKDGDQKTYSITLPKNIQVLTENINIDSVIENTQVEFLINNLENTVIKDLLLNDVSIKDSISDSKFLITIKEDSVLKLVTESTDNNENKDTNSDSNTDSETDNDSSTTDNNGESLTDTNNVDADGNSEENKENTGDSNTENTSDSDSNTNIEEKVKKSTINLEGFVENTQEVNQNEAITLHLNIPENNHLLTLTVNGEDNKNSIINNTFTFTPDKENYDIVATYEVNTYSLNLQSQELSVNGDLDLTKISYGTSVSVNISVPNNKKIAKLLLNGSDRRHSVNNNVYTFEITNNTDISVEFKEISSQKQYYSLTLGENLVVSDDINKDRVEGTQSVRIFINIPSGKEIKSLLVNDVNQLENMNEDKTFIDLNLTKNTNVSVTFRSSNQNKGSAMIISSQNQHFEINNQVKDFYSLNAGDKILVKIVNIPEGKEVKTILFNNQDITSRVQGNYFSVVATNNYPQLSIELQDKTPVVINTVELEKTINLADEKKKSSTYIYENRQEIKDKFDEILAEAKKVLANPENQDKVDENVWNLQDIMDELNGQFSEKSIDLKNIETIELLKVSSTHETEKINALTEQIIDFTDYKARIISDNKEFILPIKAAEEENQSYIISVDLDKIVYFNKDNDAIQKLTFAVDKISHNDNEITDFNTLITKLNNATDNQEIIIGADLDATDTTSNSYVTKTFKGVLKSSNGRIFAINGLKKPLFSKIENAKIENINILNANVTSNSTSGILASEVVDSSVKNTKITGQLKYQQNGINTEKIGGVFGTVLGLTFTHNTIDVTLDISANDTDSQYYGILSSQISGYNHSIDISNNYIKGNIQLDRNHSSSKIGKLVGNVSNVEIQKTIVDVQSGSYNLIFGQTYNNSAQISASFTTLDNQPNELQKIEKSELTQKLLELGILVETQQKNDFAHVNFALVQDYDSKREIAYDNVAKLIPFYDRNTIVSYGNKISTSDVLYQKRISSLMPLDDNNNFVGNLYNKDEIKKIFITFEDNTSTTFTLSSPVEFENSHIFEYSFNNLIYTPYQFLNKNSDLINELKSEFKQLQLNSQEFINHVKMNEYVQKLRDKNNNQSINLDMNWLYLNDTFKHVQDNIDNYLESILANYKVANYNDLKIKEVVKKEILDNKVQIMLGLSYLERLYNIKFGHYNIKNILMFNPAFYNNDINNIEFIKSIGNLSFEDLLLENNYSTFTKIFNTLNKHSKDANKDLYSFLELNNSIFNNKTMSEWLKESSNAFIYELSSEKNNVDVSLYNRLKNKSTARSYILPLLNVKEDNIYVISTFATIYFGGYGRNIDETIAKDSPEYKTKLQETKNKVKLFANKFKNFLELMYSVSNDEGKREMQNTITEIFDGYWIVSKNGPDYKQSSDNRRRWADRFDENYSPIKDFFGPIGKYYPQSPKKDGAYANQNTKIIRFDSADVLSIEGASTLTHELTHAYDKKTWLQNHNYRPGQGPEAYALGFFESATSNNTPYYSFNFIANLNGEVTTNNSIDRFKSKEDFKSYLHNLFDVTYLIEGLEAEVISNRTNEEKSQILEKLVLEKDDASKWDKNSKHIYFYTDKDIQKGYVHGVDKVEQLSEEELSKLTSLDALIDNNVISKSENFAWTRDSETKQKTAQRTNNLNYYFVSLYNPIFAAYANDSGTSGGLMFRKTAFELLAEYGWDNGFIKYATDSLAQNATNNEKLSDTYVFSQIFNGQYNSYAEFKKTMYKQRLAKQNTIKEITVRYNNRDYLIRNGDDIKQLLKQTYDDNFNDIKLNPQKVYFNQLQLKEQIIKKFNEKTNNFRESIFK
ncbi:hypothetical protein N8G13_00705 [Mycoplasma zalophi]|uniref:ZmpA/ZmpB/ZmpC family metallo-endopeptidase n=1 Tax=Mycoplasma zalophi TaxID=191287 RepID=UPI0021CA7697|nr:ZmpA/ZmpB/ZmpC family metallo-endopeptidase [Mycoplasma zalophi]MCU4116983.1 hypothetical protein [Mycoplasma zalophi]